MILPNQDAGFCRKRYFWSILALSMCLLQSWRNENNLLRSWKTSGPDPFSVPIGQFTFREFPKVVHEIGWWTPHVEKTARTFQTWKGPKYGWCQPTNRTDMILSLPSNDVIPKGLMYVKSPKTSSSTCSGLNIAISRNVARRLRQASAPSASGVYYSEFTQCEHYDRYSIVDRNWNTTSSTGSSRNRNESLLWTFVRHPRSRDVSYIYFFQVSLMGVNPNDTDTLMKVLAFQQSRQSLYIDVGPKIEKKQLHALLSNPQTASVAMGERIFDNYDFIGVLERRLESLAVMTLLWDLDPTDVIVLSAKQAGKYHDPPNKNKNCFKIQEASHLHPRIERYLNSSEYMGRHADFLLYYAADLSLDRTIEALGYQLVRERAQLISRLEQLAEKECRTKAVFPCSVDGIRNAETNCFSRDFGCGYECIEEVMEYYRRGKLVLSE